MQLPKNDLNVQRCYDVYYHAYPEITHSSKIFILQDFYFVRIIIWGYMTEIYIYC